MSDLVCSKFHQKTLFLSGFFVVLFVLISGCSKSAPQCDNEKTVDTVINIVSQDIKNDLSSIAGAGGPGMELTDDEWKLLRAGMVINLENIREQSYDKDTGKRICAANLMIASSGSKELIPVTYTAEISKDTGDLKVTLSGLQEFKKAKSVPEPEPE